MEQVTLYLGGERDYTKIEGGTGPLVYPAAHVYIYELLYRYTDQGRDIPFAQIIFGLLYLLTLAVVMACYRNAKVRSASIKSLNCLLTDQRYRRMSIRCSSCLSVCTLFLRLDCSTIALPFFSSFWPSTATKNDGGSQDRCSTLLDWASR